MTRYNEWCDKWIDNIYIEERPPIPPKRIGNEVYFPITHKAKPQ